MLSLAIRFSLADLLTDLEIVEITFEILNYAMDLTKL